MQIYKFRDCLLNTVERSVIRGREHIELTTKTFDVLQFLIENGGKVVTKDELLGNVWNGNFVEESNLPVHISKLRRSLNETRDHRFIETVQGTGYRFVAPVRETNNDEWLKISDGSCRVKSARHQDKKLWVAVLPLQNISGDPNHDYLIDGLTESLINRLTLHPGLKVLARDTVFRYRNTDVDAKGIGELLGVSHVITGRARIAGATIAIGIELISVNDGAQVWGTHYDRNFPDIVGLEDDVALTVAESLESTSGRKTSIIANSLTRDPESYRLYLKGRYFLEKHSAADMYKAIDLFEESISLDSENVHSYVEIVECYRSLHAFGYISYQDFLEVIKPVLARVATVDDSVDSLQVMYCDLRMLEWRFDDAAKFCRRALSLNPNCLKGRLRYSDLLLQSRTYTAALEQLEKVMIIDPLSPLIYKRIGRLFYMMGEDENATAYLNDALDLDPLDHEALTLRGAVHTETGNYEEALADFNESMRAAHNVETLALTGVVYAKQGNGSKANRIIKKVESESSDNMQHSTQLAHIYIALGKTDEAFKLLARAFEQHEPDLRALTYDRRWITIREEPRFKKLAKHVGLPI